MDTSVPYPAAPDNVRCRCDARTAGQHAGFRSLILWRIHVQIQKLNGTGPVKRNHKQYNLFGIFAKIYMRCS